MKFRSVICKSLFVPAAEHLLCARATNTLKKMIKTVVFSEGGDSSFTKPRPAASFTIFQDEQDKENFR